MNKLRKAIIKWLLGADWEEYWELHRKYGEELGKHMDDLNKLITLSKQSIKENEEHIKTLNVVKKLIDLCKENGIEYNHIKWE